MSLKVDTPSTYLGYFLNQVRGNLVKIFGSYVSEEGVKEICEWLKTNYGEVESVLCHGTRHGEEQELFKKHLGKEVYVLGTDISPTAWFFKDTVRYDFNFMKEEWKNKFDVVFSNSLDHSFHISGCLLVWFDEVKPGGFVIVEWSECDKEPCKYDPIGITKEKYKEMFDTLNIKLVEEIEVDAVDKGRDGSTYFILQKEKDGGFLP